ncbi:MAG: Ca2+-dependent phosphoinositide-specific phospholipase C, partial [Verrucomicrobiales bacterium]
VRGDFDTLRNAVTNRGWPALDSVRGKIMFALDNGGSLRDQYLEGHASLKGRLLFASVDEDHPAAAWFKINNPVGEFDRIQRLVRVGFMVRTRADAGTKQARENDVFQRDKAFASGAQFISTDYPEANKVFSAYQVRLPGYDVARTNPINGSEKLKGIDLETPLVKTDVRIAAYNVLFGNWATPEAVGTMFLPYDLDIIGFSEVPNGDWTARVGKVLGMEHAYVGEISSANHVNKYKSILSRTPLTNTHEIDIPNHGWSPASLVGAETNVKGVPMLVYATHIPGRPAFIEDASGAAATFLAESVIPQAIAYAAHVVLVGDLNHWIGDAPFDLIEAAGMHSMWKDLEIDTQRLSTHQHIESGTESGVIDHILWHPSSAIRATQGGVIYNGFNLPDTDRTMERYQREWEQSGKPLSDHRPVWVSLEFTNTPSH